MATSGFEILQETTRIEKRKKKKMHAVISARGGPYSQPERTFGDKEKMLLNDRVLVELQIHATSAITMGEPGAKSCKSAIHERVPR
jgi:hypothetical protein